jgi:hypothetical protein
MLSGADNWNIIIYTRNKGAMLMIQQPRQPSGQEYIRCIYDSLQTLKEQGNTVAIPWIPSGDEHDLLREAKDAARGTTGTEAVPQVQFPRCATVFRPGLAIASPGKAMDETGATEVTDVTVPREKRLHPGRDYFSRNLVPYIQQRR